MRSRGRRRAAAPAWDTGPLVRLPGYVISIDAIFGMPEKLILRHGQVPVQSLMDGASWHSGVGKLVSSSAGLDRVMSF
jgi:hypothetical protein